MSGDPSLDVLLRPSVHLLFRKDNTLMHSHLVLVPLEHVSNMELVLDSEETVLTVSWLISLQPCFLGLKL